MRSIARVSFLLSAVLVTSCSLSPMKVGHSSTYTLTDWPGASVPHKAAATTSKTLLVTTPLAAPGYESSRMVYVAVPYQLSAFGDHRWVAPPADLLLPLLANHIRRLGYFHAVAVAPFSGAATYQLNTHLLMLQQEFLQPQSKVRLTIEATVIQVATGNVLADRIFNVSEPAMENNPYAGVLATNKAAGVVTNQIAQFVVKTVTENKVITGSRISK